MLSFLCLCKNPSSFEENLVSTVFDQEVGKMIDNENEYG